MKFLNKCLLLSIWCILCFFASYAQKRADITGRVFGGENRGLASASLFLLRSADSSLVKVTVSDKNGLFKFNDIGSGTYFIRTTYTGYKKNLFKSIIVNEGAALNVGVIVLTRTDNKLSEIAVTAGRNFIETRGDKVILNIQNSALSAGSNALEILKRAPGIKLDDQENIALNGRAGVTVMVDGKSTYLSGEALTAFLQSTQSSTIDRIELVSNPNANTDAEGAGGMINIRLKRDKSLGFNATINATGGITQTGLDGEDGRGKVGLNFNYRSKKVNVFGSYGFADDPLIRTYVTSRLVNFNTQVSQIGVNWISDYTRKTHSFRVGTDYYLDANNIIGVLVNGYFFNQDGAKNTLSTTGKPNGFIDSTINTRSDLNRYQALANFDLNYKHNFGKSADLSFDAVFINYVKHYGEAIQSDYFMVNNPAAYRSLSFKNTSPSNYGQYVFNAVYHLNIDKNTDFSATAKSTFANTDNFSDFGSMVNGGYTSIPKFSSQFKYYENINATSIDLNHIFSKKWAMELGLRVEQTVSNGSTPNTNEMVKRNYVDFFPNAQVTNTINDDNQLLLTLSRRISRPAYESLNPLLTYVDQYDTQVGNPYLKPYYTNLAELTHTFKGKFTTKLTASITNGYTQTVFMQNDTTKVINLKRINLGNRYDYGVIFNAPATFNKWYSVDFSLSALFQRFTSSSSAGNLDNRGEDVTIDVMQHFKLPLALKADLAGEFETPSSVGILRYKRNYVFRAALSKSILQKQGTIGLTVDDILNSDKGLFSSNYQNLNITGNQKTIFRTILLNFSYSFGSQSIKAARRRATGAEEEQSRTAGQ